MTRKLVSTDNLNVVEITDRAVMPPGNAQPLHVLLAEMLRLSGTQVSTDPGAIFDWISREVALYSGMDYETVGLLGAAPAHTA